MMSTMTQMIMMMMIVTKLTAGIIAASSLGGKRVHTEADKYNAQLPSLRTSHPDRLGFVLVGIQISFGKQIDICQFNAPTFSERHYVICICHLDQASDFTLSVSVRKIRHLASS